MKIGIVCPYNMALGGAVQEICKEQYREFVRRGHEAAILTPYPRQGEPIELDERVIYVGRGADPKTPLGTVAQVSYCANPKEIDDILQAEQFDILQVHEPWVPLLGRQIIERKRCPVVATFHAKLPDNWAGSAVKHLGQLYTLPPLKYLDEIVYVSEAAGELVGRLAKRPMHYIPNAVNLEAFHPSKAKTASAKTNPTILFVGRHEERKGVTYLLSAFKILKQRQPKAQLIIGGAGPDTEKLKQQVDSEAIEDVNFTGFLSDSEKKALMRKADIFVSPAMYGESFGVVLIEALASGAVVVAGDNPGYRSVMKGAGQIGLVNSLDFEQCADRLELLLTNSALRLELKTWAADYVKQFDYRTVTDAYEKIYQKLYKQEFRCGKKTTPAKAKPKKTKHQAKA